MGKPKQRELVELRAPSGLVAHSFVLGSDEFALLEFPLSDGPPIDAEVGLTESESAVLSLVLRGESNAEIALARGTSPRTVANQIAAVYRKLGVTSRRELFARDRALRDAPA